MKEENLNVKEVKKKKIQKLRKIISFGETFLIVVPTVVLFLSIILFILGGLAGEETSLVTEMNNVIGVTEENNFTNQEDIKNVIAAIFSIIGYILYILIINKIKKVFINIENNETPFTEENIILLMKIKKLVLISFCTIFLGNKFGISLIPVTIVLALTFVFEHGCELQKEVDETL